MKNKKDSIVIKPVSMSLVHERVPFPTMYVTIDPNTLEVWFKIFVYDSQLRDTFDVEFVKNTIAGFIHTDRLQWKIEKDVTFRCVELYCVINLRR